MVILAYAYDTVLVAQGDSRQIMERNLQTAVQLTFSAVKIKAMVLKGTLAEARHLTVRIGGTAVRFHERVVFLGVTLDKILAFLPHVKEVSMRASIMSQKIMRLVKPKYGVQPNVYFVLYRTVFRPIVQYAKHFALRECQISVLLCMGGTYWCLSRLWQRYWDRSLSTLLLKNLTPSGKLNMG